MRPDLRPGGALRLQLVRMSCGDCSKQRGSELPQDLVRLARCVAVPLPCSWCCRDTLHSLVAPGMHQLVRG